VTQTETLTRVPAIELPRWLDGKANEPKFRSGYTRHYARVLRDQYLELVMLFERVTEECPDEVARQKTLRLQIGDLLVGARAGLERLQDLDEVHSLMDNIARRMVNLYSAPFARAASYGILARLRDRCSLNFQRLCKPIEQLSSNEIDESQLTELRSLLDEALRVCSTKEKEAMRASMLQVSRLRWLNGLAFVVFLMLLGLSPALVNADSLHAWPLRQLNLKITFDSHVLCWSCAIGMMAVGVAGGVISMLLGARRTSVRLWEYRESNARLLLKPLIGGTASLLVFIFLSWGLLPGIKIVSPGSYILVAFLCGFSERFFEGLFQPADETPQAATPS